VFPAIRARLDDGETLLLPDAALRGPEDEGEGRSRRVVVAALVVLLAVAGSAAAAVGVVGLRPLQRWVGLGDGGAVTTQPEAGPPLGGVEVDLPPSGLDVVLEEVADSVTVVVTLVDGRRLQMTGSDGVARAGFRLGEGRVTVRGARSGEVRLGVPRNAAGSVRILAGSRLVGLAQEGVVRLRGREPATEARSSLGALLAGGGS
jgi:hypothetical protein